MLLWLHVILEAVTLRLCAFSGGSLRLNEKKKEHAYDERIARKIFANRAGLVKRGRSFMLDSVMDRNFFYGTSYIFIKNASRQNCGRDFVAAYIILHRDPRLLCNFDRSQPWEFVRADRDRQINYQFSWLRLRSVRSRHSILLDYL